MLKRKLGSSNLEVSALGLRCMAMFILVLAGFFLTNNTLAMNKSKEGPSYTHDKDVTHSSEISYEVLKAVGENFVSFLRKTGQSETPVTQDEFQIFSPQCKKVVNGKVLFTSLIAYPAQIANARRAIGKWTVKTLWATASKEDRTYTVQVKGSAEKMPEFTTMATLFLDEAGKISEIHEVYNLYDQQKLSIQDN